MVEIETYLHEAHGAVTLVPEAKLAVARLARKQFTQTFLEFR